MHHKNYAVLYIALILFLLSIILTAVGLYKRRNLKNSTPSTKDTL